MKDIKKYIGILIDIFKIEHGITISVVQKENDGWIGVIKYERINILRKNETYTVTLEEYPNYDRGVDQTGTWEEAAMHSICIAHKNIKYVNKLI